MLIMTTLMMDQGLYQWVLLRHQEAPTKPTVTVHQVSKALRGQPGVQQHYGGTWMILPLLAPIGYGKLVTHEHVG